MTWQPSLTAGSPIACPARAPGTQSGLTWCRSAPSSWFVQHPPPTIAFSVHFLTMTPSFTYRHISLYFKMKLHVSPVRGKPALSAAHDGNRTATLFCTGFHGLLKSLSLRSACSAQQGQGRRLDGLTPPPTCLVHWFRGPSGSKGALL